jgi:hypothetical protein
MSTLLLVAWLAAAPSRLSGDAYIVALKDAVTAEEVKGVAADLVRRHGGFLEHVYREESFRGFSARLPPVAASGMRRDPRVASVEALAVPETPGHRVEVEEDGVDTVPSSAKPKSTDPSAPSATVTTPRERLPFAPGFYPRFRRVVSPEADRYVVVLSSSVRPDAMERIAHELVAAHGAARGPVEAGAFVAEMTEAAARKVSRDPRVEFVEEKAIATADSASAPRARRLPGQTLRRVAQPRRDHYRLVLRPNVPDERIAETVAELLRAYEGRRTGTSDDPRVVLVEMSEPSALALSDDLRVERVEEQPAASRAGGR